MPTLIRGLFHPVLLLWHIKDPSFCQKRKWQKYLNMPTSLTQQSWSGLTMLSMHSVGTSQGKEATCNLSGNTWPQSSQLAEPLWTDLVLKSGIGVCEMIHPPPPKKNKKQKQIGNELSDLPPKSLQARKKPPSRHHQGGVPLYNVSIVFLLAC